MIDSKMIGLGSELGWDEGSHTAINRQLLTVYRKDLEILIWKGIFKSGNNERHKYLF